MVKNLWIGQGGVYFVFKTLYNLPFGSGKPKNPGQQALHWSPQILGAQGHLPFLSQALLVEPRSSHLQSSKEIFIKFDI